MSNEYNEQVEGFTSSKTLEAYEFVSSSLFRVVFTTFGDGERNPELSAALSDLISEVNVSQSVVTFNVLQSVNREDLQLVELLLKARKDERPEVILHSFDNKGKSLPYYLVATVHFLSDFNLSHSTDNSWERPATNIILSVNTVVRNADTFIDDEMEAQAKNRVNN